MTRKIYLIRHAMPDLPLGERWCVGGRCDLPLGRLGRIQAARLPFVPALQGLDAVFCSSLIRARETALPLSPAPRVIQGLEEQDMGLWDGLSFREIRERFPALYAAREQDPSLLPAGAESEEAVRQRMTAALWRCLRESEGHIAVVSHKGSIASLTGRRSLLGYTSISVLEAADGELRVRQLGLSPAPEPTDALCLRMLEASGLSAGVIAHCRAVASLADELCEKLNRAGLSLDGKAVHIAALLHDLAKGEPAHAVLGGRWLRELGYDELADLIRQHTEPDSDALNEAGLVFLADKYVRGEVRVPLAERFAASAEKCKTPEARAAHARRYALALSLQQQIMQFPGLRVPEI